ncbi:olfactory receptor 1J4-like [Pelodytes ibericus]
MATLCANVMIILLVTTSQYIYSPMYFFLSHLSLNDIVLTTTIVPKMLYIILREGSAMSFMSCFTQLYFMFLSAGNYLGLQKLISMLYTIVTPILNPIIYSLKNKEIRTTLKKFILQIKK